MTCLRSLLAVCSVCAGLVFTFSVEAQHTRTAARQSIRLASPDSRTQTKVAPKITAVRAQLFYDATGTLSEDMLSRKDLALWNTIIGEGSAGSASTSTLVTVEISGRNLPVGATKVEVKAHGDKEPVSIQTRVIPVDIYDERTKFFAPFWLYDTGCEPIRFSARLMGVGAPRTVFT